jgi:hypothetical protein
VTPAVRDDPIVVVENVNVGKPRGVILQRPVHEHHRLADTPIDVVEASAVDPDLPGVPR